VVTATPLPSKEDCLALLDAMGAPSHLAGHSRAVADVARRIALLCGGDQILCYAAALVHDIGKAPRTAAVVAAREGITEAQARALDHGYLGAVLLRGQSPAMSRLAPAVESHVITAVLLEPPGTVDCQIVFLADKLVGRRWLGLGERLADLQRRHGASSPIGLSVPGTIAIAYVMAGRACLGWSQLEALLRPDSPQWPELEPVAQDRAIEHSS